VVLLYCVVFNNNYYASTTELVSYCVYSGLHFTSQPD